MPKSVPDWTPDTVHLEYLVAKVDPDYVAKHGRMRFNSEACEVIGYTKKWYGNQCVEFKRWCIEKMSEHMAFCLPRAWNRLIEIASGERKGSRAGEEVAAIKLLMERFDPDFKRDKGGVNITVKTLTEICEAAEAEPYTVPTYDIDDLPQEELPIPELDELRDDAVSELVGEDVA